MTLPGPAKIITVEPRRRTMPAPAPAEPAKPVEAPEPKRKPEKVPA
jgi:hypothetical protein